ncbi:MAG: hypothetical protein ILNGONEN_00197 [Syntrophorhabdaceae bacterium]|nr:hypothetical protein [Syntrophorhabdaceae bacterium]
MNDHKIKLTAPQAQRLMAAIRDLPAEPVGACLLSDDFSAYVKENLTSERVQEIEKHLFSCPNCAEKMESTFALLRDLLDLDPVLTEELNEMITNLRDKLTELRIAASSRVMWRFKSTNGNLSATVSRHGESATLYFASNKIERAGVSFRIGASSAEEKVEFKMQNPTEVGAKCTMPWKYLADLQLLETSPSKD